MTRLTDALRHAADPDGDPAVDLGLDLGAVHARVDRRRRIRLRARAGACVAAAVVVAGGLGLAAGAGDDGTEVRAGGLAEETTTVPDPSSTEASTTVDPSSTAPSTTVEPSSTTTGPPSTTTPPPSTAAPPTSPPATAPSTAVVDMTWTYVGDERYTLDGSACPDITHWIDADAVADDGEPWTLREDYCGTHVGRQWSGTGTFTMTASSGGTLTGRKASTAPVGTTGQPYQWWIEGGTGVYAGATGECVVTVRLSDHVLGRQHHEGEIRCTVAGLGFRPLDPTTPDDSVPESA